MKYCGKRHWNMTEQVNEVLQKKKQWSRTRESQYKRIVVNSEQKYK